MACTADDRIGSLLAASNVYVRLEFVNPSTGQTITNAGFSGTYSSWDVKVCGWAILKSTTGLTAPLLNGKRMSASSEIRLEQMPSYDAGDYPSAPPAGFTC